MTQFTAKRKYHQNPIGGQITGEVTIDAIMEETNRYIDALGYTKGKMGWEGCIDAPELIAAGSMVSLSPREIEGGHYWEGAEIGSNWLRGKV